MKIKEIIGGFMLAGGWGSILLSIVFYLFFWRVDNEPGAKDVPALLWATISFCSLGGLAFLGVNIYLIKERSWIMLVIAWVVCIALLIGSVSLSPILLLFMA